MLERHQARALIVRLQGKPGAPSDLPGWAELVRAIEPAESAFIGRRVLMRLLRLANWVPTANEIRAGLTQDTSCSECFDTGWKDAGPRACYCTTRSGGPFTWCISCNGSGSGGNGVERCQCVAEASR